MRKTLTYIFLLSFIVFAFSCALKEASETSEQIAIDVQIDESLLDTNIFTLEVDEFIELKKGPTITYRRTYCYGMCPVFKSEISADGKVKYEGINFVDNMGMHEAFMTTAQLDSIVTKVHEINYFELDSAYDNEFIMDIPSVITSVTLEGKKHSVLDRYQSPKELRVLYKEIDDIFATLKWEPANKND